MVDSNSLFTQPTYASAMAGANAMMKSAMHYEALCMAGVIDLDPNEPDGRVNIEIQELYDRVGSDNIRLFQEALEEIGFTYQQSDSQNVDIAVNQMVVNYVKEVLADGEMSPEEITRRYKPAIETFRRALAIQKRNASAVELRVMTFVLNMREPVVSMSQAKMDACFGRDDVKTALSIIEKLGLPCNQRKHSKGSALGKTSNDEIVWIIGSIDGFDAWAKAQEEASLRGHDILKNAEK